MLLAGAVVVPSEEDFLVFTVAPTNGEAYKLKAGDTRQKQEWINRLRLLAEEHKDKQIQVINCLP